MEVCYLFIESPSTKIEEIIILEANLVFDDEDDTIEEYKRLVNDRIISIYIPGGVPSDLKDLQVLRPGFFPWHDDDPVEYYICEKGDIIIKRTANVEQEKLSKKTC